MSWDLILLLSVLCSVISQLIDKHTTRKAGAWDCTTFGVVFQLVLLTPFLVLWQTPSLPIACVLLAVGMLTASARFFWYKALIGDELSRVSPFRRLSTLFTLFLGAYVLGESEQLQDRELLGALVIVLGSLLIAFEDFKRTWRNFFHINRYIACVLYFAASLAIMKAVSREMFAEYAVTVFSAYFTMKVGQLLFVLPGLRHARRVDRIWTLSLSQIFQMIGAAMFLFVISKQELVLSEPIAALSPALLLVLDRIIFKEKIRMFKYRLGAIAVMALGYLLMKGFLL